MYRVLFRTCVSGYELVTQATQAIYRILSRTCASGYTGYIQNTFVRQYRLHTEYFLEFVPQALSGLNHVLAHEQEEVLP